MTLENKIKAAIRNIPNFPKEGIDFKDISGIFLNPGLSKEIIEELAAKAKGKVDAVCGVESRGFIFGFPLALALDVPFILVRKKGKLPPPTRSVSYDLEYGSAALEVVEHHIEEGMRILIHDDVLATGGTANATAQLVESLGGTVAQFNFLVELDFLNGREKLGEAEVVSLIHY